MAHPLEKLSLSYALTIIFIGVCQFSTFVSGENIRELLASHPELIESEIFAKESGILDDIAADEYGGALTLMFPTNAAWDDVSKERRDYLLNPDNKEALETLLLFSTTDSAIYRDDIADGESIITLLGVEALVNKSNNSICVLDYAGYEYDCADIAEWDITVDEGVVYIIHKVLYPQELLEDPSFPN